MNVDKDTEQKIKQLQMLEQNLQGYLSQRQQLQSQMIEIDSALGELGTDSTTYKIIGNIMIKKASAEIQKELTDKKEVIELKIKSIEKQEKSLKDKSKTIQEEVMTKMNKGSE